MRDATSGDMTRHYFFPYLVSWIGFVDAAFTRKLDTRAAAVAAMIGGLPTNQSPN